MATLKGKWTFNLTLSSDTSDNQTSINFTSHNMNFYGINASVSGTKGLLYYQQTQNGPWDMIAYSTYHSFENNWQYDDFRIIDFGETEQTVSDTFYNWFIANATQDIESSITDLTNTTWNIPSGWLATASYGSFDVEGTVFWESNTSYSQDFVKLFVGYRYNSDGELVSDANHIYFASSGESEGSYYSRYFENSEIVPVTFTGGDDVTNASLISWLETYGEQVKPSNLTNTTWEFIYELRAQSTESITINVDFTSNGNNYTKIVFEPDTGLTFVSGTSNTTVYSILDETGSWVDEEYRTINITGGTDVANATAIINLNTLATLTSDGTEDENASYEVVYNDKVIGTIERGQTITLKCFSMKMASNVIVRVKIE